MHAEDDCPRMPSTTDCRVDMVMANTAIEIGCYLPATMLCAAGSSNACMDKEL